MRATIASRRERAPSISRLTKYASPFVRSLLFRDPNDPSALLMRQCAARRDLQRGPIVVLRNCSRAERIGRESQELDSHLTMAGRRPTRVPCVEVVIGTRGIPKRTQVN